MDGDRRAELHTAMPIQRLPLNLPRFPSCPLPSPDFQGGVPVPRCQHVMSLPIVRRNDDQLYLEKSEVRYLFMMLLLYFKAYSAVYAYNIQCK